jgi:hypothetical protein
MEKKYYIYAHIRNDTNNIFYIGKGCGKRAYIKSNRSLYWKRIVEKYNYRVEFLLENLTEEEAYKFEIYYIDIEKNKGNCEANFTSGGDGVKVEKRWWNDKISKALKGKICPKGIENKSYKEFCNKEELYDLYINQKKSSVEISKIFNVSYTTVTFRLKEFNIEKRKCGRISKKIICINDNKIFNSLSEAAIFYNLHRENISKVLKGIYKHTGNKKFEYLN